jgi:hypothetical protein
MTLRLLAALWLLPLLATAQDADLKPLFNPNDLAGWTPVNVAPNTFTIKDGLITCTGVPTGMLRTEKMYENFVVELEWRHLKPNGNAGFFVWSDAVTSKGVPFTRAVEVQVLDGPNHPERRHTTHGDVFPIHGVTMTPGNPAGKGGQRSYPTEDRSKPSPEWNHYRVECVGGAISLAVNGKVVTTGTNASPRKGYLCLESEGGVVEWRNLKIKELPPSADLDPKHVAKADEGYKSLYTGLDLTGWDVTAMASAAWKPKDWTLHFAPPTTGNDADPTLRTAAKFTELDMILDLRTAAPFSVTFRGATVTVAPPEKQPRTTWRRLHLRTKDDQLTIHADDQPLPATPLTDSAPSPIALRPAGTADVANLYAKPTR